MDLGDRGVLERAVRADSCLSAGHGHGVDACSPEFMGDHHCGDDLSGGSEKVSLTWVGRHRLDETEQRVRGVRGAIASHGGDHDHWRDIAFKRLGDTCCDRGTSFWMCDRRAAELHHDYAARGHRITPP